MYIHEYMCTAEILTKSTALMHLHVCTFMHVCVLPHLSYRHRHVHVCIWVCAGVRVCARACTRGCDCVSAGAHVYLYTSITPPQVFPNPSDERHPYPYTGQSFPTYSVGNGWKTISSRCTYPNPKQRLKPCVSYMFWVGNVTTGVYQPLL